MVPVITNMIAPLAASAKPLTVGKPPVVTGPPVIKLPVPDIPPTPLTLAEIEAGIVTGLP